MKSEKIFSIVSFISRGRPAATKDVDIVPSSWLMWDGKKKKCVTKFPPPPYDQKTCSMLHEMVSTLKDPLDDWSVYSVNLKGEASKSTYFIN